MDVTRILAVAAGGALGALMRYGLTGWVQGWAGSRFPWGTLAVNAAGSLALGVVMAFALTQAEWSGPLRTFVGIGLLGAFTTYSTFAYETVALLHAGDWTGAVANVGLNLVVGLAAIVAGLRLGSL